MNTEVLTFGRLRGFGARERALLLLSIVCGAIYLATVAWPELPARVFFKALSIGPLAVMAYRLLRERLNQPRGIARFANLLRDRDNLILGAALGFSCLGDIYLGVDATRYFIFGLLAFFAAHFIYILLFVRNWPLPLRPSGGQMALAAMVLVYSLLLSNWLAPSLGGFAKPVMMYVCALTVMVVTAIFAGFSRPWVWIGAILFLISDSIIAIQKFKYDLPWGGFLIWATYYLGQYGIAVGFLREKLGEE